jgi:hypothetical protein
MNQTNDSRLHSWRRWLVEIFVIVLSILLAFGIEAWWEERKDRLEEIEVLAGLEREFLIYQEKLNGAITKHAQMQAAMEALLSATETGRCCRHTDVDFEGPDRAHHSMR